MALEDHAGDVLAKARAAAGVSVEEAAALAGLKATAYERFEQTGQGSPSPKLAALAERLGLHGERLSAIAAGWQPVAREPGRWRELRQITTSEGMAVNCYLIWDPATREAALFDTGWQARPVFDLVGSSALKLKHLFITHSHHDHVAALEEIRNRFPGLQTHRGSRPVLPDRRSTAGEVIELGDLRISTRPTPGHAEDGATYVIDHWPGGMPPVAIVGDAIFAGSMGRALGPAFEIARRAIRDEIFSLPPGTLICPGHGPVTTVVEEQEHNPFFP